MNAQERKLPAPLLTGGMPMNEVIAFRQSIRQFDPSRQIDDAVLGQILWLTAGINRPNAKPSHLDTPANRSNPTARNWQEIRLYVFGMDGVYEYDYKNHSLITIKEGDYRSMIAGDKQFSQDFVMNAPYSIVFVADLSDLPESDHVKSMALVDAGIACENLNLACTSVGLATVPRATMDSAAISKLLGLSTRQFPVINNPVAYAK